MAASGGARWLARRARFPRVAAALAFLAGCGGASPLLHPAHVLSPGSVQLGAGAAARISALEAAPESGDEASDGVLEDVAVAPGIGPWVGARVGIEGGNEAGLVYHGRSVRLDARHAFELSRSVRLSAGVGGSALLPRPRGGNADLGSVYGGGADVPVLIGWSSDADLYTFWAGPRGGFELLRGRLLETELSPSAVTSDYLPVEGTHAFVGGLVGMRVGFRSVHVALEVDVTYHRAWGTFAGIEADVEQVAVAPGSALFLSF